MLQDIEEAVGAPVTIYDDSIQTVSRWSPAYL